MEIFCFFISLGWLFTSIVGLCCAIFARKVVLQNKKLTDEMRKLKMSDVDFIAIKKENQWLKDESQNWCDVNLKLLIDLVEKDILIQFLKNELQEITGESDLFTGSESAKQRKERYDRFYRQEAIRLKDRLENGGRLFE